RRQKKPNGFIKVFAGHEISSCLTISLRFKLRHFTQVMIQLGPIWAIRDTDGIRRWHAKRRRTSSPSSTVFGAVTHDGPRRRAGKPGCIIMIKKSVLFKLPGTRVIHHNRNPVLLTVSLAQWLPLSLHLTLICTIG